MTRNRLAIGLTTTAALATAVLTYALRDTPDPVVQPDGVPVVTLDPTQDADLDGVPDSLDRCNTPIYADRDAGMFNDAGQAVLNDAGLQRQVTISNAVQLPVPWEVDESGCPLPVALGQQHRPRDAGPPPKLRQLYQALDAAATRAAELRQAQDAATPGGP